MSRTDVETMKQRILARYDADYIVDVLRISAEELLDAFEPKLLLMFSSFDELENAE